PHRLYQRGYGLQLRGWIAQYRRVDDVDRIRGRSRVGEPTAGMTTANEILIDALVDINALAPGQTLPATNAAVALRKLNDLIDSLSLDQDFIYTTVENIFPWTPNQFKYTVGNPIGGKIGRASCRERV